MGKCCKKYRMVFDEKNKKFVIERKVDLVFFEFWSRNYLWDYEKTCFETDEVNLAVRIVKILNGELKYG